MDLGQGEAPASQEERGVKGPRTDMDGDALIEGDPGEGSATKRVRVHGFDEDVLDENMIASLIEINGEDMMDAIRAVLFRGVCSRLPAAAADRPRGDGGRSAPFADAARTGSAATGGSVRR